MDLLGSLDSLDPLDHPENRLTLMDVTFRRELLAHLDLQGYKGKWDRKVTKEIPVFYARAVAHLDYLEPRVLKETEDLLVQLAAKEKRVFLGFLDNLEDLVLKELLD